MPRVKSALSIAAILSALFVPVLVAAERTPWTTSRVHGSPEPPSPCRIERAYPNLTFAQPLDAVLIPGTDRLVIVENKGRLFTIPSDETCTQADPFGDLKQFEREATECYGIAFHPQFAKNRFAFVWMNLDLQGKRNREDGTRIVRFRVTGENPPRLDLPSGQVVFSWLGGGHNGGNVRFGPDGMLYLSTGDGGSPDPPDPLATGQDISDVLSSVLRIDVDRPDPGKAYGIPKDNPFITTPGARGEVWAYGFRNPWRLSFDPKTGALWVGDVGWELWEMIYRVERGGNYGWSINEGSHQDVRPDRPRGPTPILPPAAAHAHIEAASITGGDVYYGKRMPELTGSYIYGDWQLGTFWALRDGVVRELCRSTLLPGGFGVAADGELIICDHGAGGLWRLVRNPEAGQPSHFPRKLSETGVFADAAKQTAAEGVMSYAVNEPRWADHATGERWIAVPGNSDVTAAAKELGVLGKGRWVFPKDTVFTKTYSLEMERGHPETARRIETQLLHFDGLQWAAYSYRWNDAQTDADLVPAQGAEVDLPAKDAQAPGGVRRQTWRYFSRAECLRCHNMRENFAPGFCVAQLDRPATDAAENQLDLLNKIGLAPVASKKAGAGKDLVETRARMYLHANCATCHRQHGGGAVPSWMNIEAPLADARLIKAKPVQGDLGLPEGRVIAPGDPARSVLIYRMATAGRGHMPYLGGKLVDDEGLARVSRWVLNLKSEQGLPAAVEQQRDLETKAMTALLDGDLGQLEPLFKTSSGTLSVALVVADGTLKGDLRAKVIAKGSALTDPMRRDLFERFLPPEQRRKVLGPNIQPDSLLSGQGDWFRGQTLFTALCSACHRAGAEGTDFGPDLTHIAVKYDRRTLLEQILAPAKNIEPPWFLATVTLTNGESVTGFIAAKSGPDITLKLAGGAARNVAGADIAKTTTDRISLMPEGLLQGLTAKEAADLLEFVGSLK